jgi:hypothetical protein
MGKIAKVIAIVYTALLTIFALLSGAGAGVGGVLSNLPNIAPWLLAWVAVIVAWRHKKAGGWLFIVLAVASMLFFSTYQQLVPFLLVTAPLAVIGGLFLMDARSRVASVESPRTPEQS